MENGSLKNLWRLLDAVDLTLKRAARCEGVDRLRLVQTARADTLRAGDFWADGRVDGLELARLSVEEAVTRLASARQFRSEAHRAELITQAHIKVIAALREVENTLARSRETEANDAGHQR